MDQRNSYYKTNIATTNLTAVLVKDDSGLGGKNPAADDDDVKWPCLEETASAKDSSTETSSTTSRDVTSDAANRQNRRKPSCTIGTSF